MEKAWRKIVISKEMKLRKKGECLVLETEDNKKNILLDEIQIILFEDPSINITSSILCELANRNISVVFCDRYYKPTAQLQSYSSNSLTSGNLNKQIEWSVEQKDFIWHKILNNKLYNQAELLSHLNLNVTVMMDFEIKDINILEAEMARKYFREIFGNKFNRRTESNINAALNYGYTILLANVSRNIALHGYYNALGIHHCNMKNPWNLACDIMEPFRPFVDEIVYNNSDCELDREYKKLFLEMGEHKIIYNNKIYSLDDAINIYTEDILRSLSSNIDDVKEIKFING